MRLLQVPPTSFDMARLLKTSLSRSFDTTPHIMNTQVVSATLLPLSAPDTSILSLMTSLIFLQGALPHNLNHTLPFNCALLSPLLSLLPRQHYCDQRAIVYYRGLYMHLFRPSLLQFRHAGRHPSLLTSLRAHRLLLCLNAPVYSSLYLLRLCLHIHSQPIPALLCSLRSWAYTLPFTLNGGVLAPTTIAVVG